MTLESNKMNKGGHNERPPTLRPKTPPKGQGDGEIALRLKSLRKINLKNDDVIVLNLERKIPDRAQYNV